jgi:hypothetical protein
MRGRRARPSTIYRGGPAARAASGRRTVARRGPRRLGPLAWPVRGLGRAGPSPACLAGASRRGIGTVQRKGPLCGRPSPGQACIEEVPSTAPTSIGVPPRWPPSSVPSHPSPSMRPASHEPGGLRPYLRRTAGHDPDGRCDPALSQNRGDETEIVRLVAPDAAVAASQLARGRRSTSSQRPPVATTCLSGSTTTTRQLANADERGNRRRRRRSKGAQW